MNWERRAKKSIRRLLMNFYRIILEKFILVGPIFQKVSAKSGFKSFHEKGKLIEYLKSEPVKGMTILVKGSRGMGLEKIYDLL